MILPRDVGFWTCWIRLQLEHNFAQLLRDSIKDFHFRGLNYICFQFLPHLTIRLYIIEPSANLETRNVNIHNHLYDSILLSLYGEIWNTTYKVNTGRNDYNIYQLTSALHPDNAEKRIRLKKVAQYGLDVVSEKRLRPGGWHFQPHTEIHSVENDPAKRTVFMAFEFPTVKKHSCIFTRENFVDTIPTEGCYNRYTEYELTCLLSRTLTALEAEQLPEEA